MLAKCAYPGLPFATARRLFILPSTSFNFHPHRWQNTGVIIQMLFDKFREECGVFGVFNHPDAANLSYLGLYALQHRGQESAGMVSSDGLRLYAERGMGYVSEPVEVLRGLLRRQVSPPLVVSGEMTQYWFDEDSANFCDIDVRQLIGGDWDFLLVVLEKRPGDTRDFGVHSWHRYAPEVWLVDAENSTVTRRLRDGVEDLQGIEGTLTSSSVPGVAIAVRSVFAAADQQS